jgi:hypothetical protein
MAVIGVSTTPILLSRFFRILSGVAVADLLLLAPAARAAMVEGVAVVVVAERVRRPAERAGVAAMARC